MTNDSQDAKRLLTNPDEGAGGSLLRDIISMEPMDGSSHVGFDPRLLALPSFKPASWTTRDSERGGDEERGRAKRVSGVAILLLPPGVLFPRKK